MKPPPKLRLDLALVERGLADSRHKAQALILAGDVFVNGQPASKASDPVRFGDSVTLREPMRFVSRGGFKLEAALDAFHLDAGGRHCLDVGASTGGFTDCLLQRGAAHVVALDVGRAQLHSRLRNDPRVTALEGLNARFLEPPPPNAPPGHPFATPFGLAVMDVSFISQRLIWPRLPPLLAPGATVVALIKPQFEAGRAEVGRGGIVRDPAVHQRVAGEIRDFVAAMPGMAVLGVIPSPIEGRDGNREFLIAAALRP